MKIFPDNVSLNIEISLSETKPKMTHSSILANFRRLTDLSDLQLKFHTDMKFWILTKNRSLCSKLVKFWLSKVLKVLSQELNVSNDSQSKHEKALRIN